MKSEAHLVFRVIKYGMNHQYFTLTQMFEEMKLGLLDKKFITDTLISRSPSHSENINHLLIITQNEVLVETKIEDYSFTLLPNAIIQYTDYLEIVEARENAKDAKQQSLIALQFSAASLIVAILLGLFQCFLTFMDILMKK